MKRLLKLAGAALRELLWVAIAIAVVFGGVQGFKFLAENKEVVTPAPVDRPITLVETTALVEMADPLPIRGEGFVKPFRQVSLAPLSGGQIIALHPAIINRGTFKKGDILGQFDDSQEQATLVQTDANIASTQARVDLNTLQLERSEALRRRGATSQQALDQVRSARAELLGTLNGMKAAQQSAKVAMSQKTVVAPFDGAVLSRTAEIGTVLASGQSMADIFTQDRMEIAVPVRDVDAALIPGLFDGDFAPAIVNIRFAGRDFQWDARVTRVAPALDTRTRTLTVSVEIDDVGATRTAGSDTPASGAFPALINSFAKVVIRGQQLDRLYPVPSTAVRGGNSIWTFATGENGNGVLKILPVDVIHVDGETSYVRPDTPISGMKLITTALAAPQPDMPLRDVGQLKKFTEVPAQIPATTPEPAQEQTQ